MRVETDDNKAYCRVCRKPFSLSSMGVGAVNEHVNGKFHKIAAAKLVPGAGSIASYFKPSPSAASVVEPASRDDFA